MNNLSRRLTALEEIAEQCRIREQRDVLRAEIERRYTAEGMTLRPDEIEQKADRALVLAEHMGLLTASGLTLPEIAQRMAVEHALEPERVLAIFDDLRAKRGATL